MSDEIGLVELDFLHRDQAAVQQVRWTATARFRHMMTSADYENLSDPHRRNGCAEHVIIATAEAYSKFKL